MPTYIKTRIYIDLSDPKKYESEYEKLLRNIYEKPQFVKPRLGKKPEWLEEESPIFSCKGFDPSDPGKKVIHQ